MVGNERLFSNYFVKFLEKNKYSQREYGRISDESAAKINYWIKNNSFQLRDLVTMSLKDIKMFNLLMEFLDDVRKDIESIHDIKIQTELQTLQEPLPPYGSTKHQDKDKDKIILELQNHIAELNKLLLTYQKIVNNENTNHHNISDNPTTTDK